MDGIIRKAITALALAAALSWAAAETVPMATKGSDAEAKKFSPPAGKANVYVARGHEAKPRPYAYKVFIDGEAAGSLAPDTFLMVSVGPGKHSIYVKALGNPGTAFDIVAEAGKNYFYGTDLKAVDPVPRVDISVVVIDMMGRQMIKQAKRVKPAAE